MVSKVTLTDVNAIADRKAAPQAIFAAIQASKTGKLSKDGAKKAAEDFESVFLGQMMQSMFPESDEPNALFGNQDGDEVFRGMMVDEYAKQISKSGGIGIAGYIQRELLGEQEIKAPRNNLLKMFKLDETAVDSSSTVQASLDKPQTAEVPMDTKVSTSIDKTADALVKEIFQGGENL